MNKKTFSTIITDVKKRYGSFLPDFNPMLRDVALYLAWEPQRTANEQSLEQARAGIVREIAHLCPLLINPGWTLAGEHLIPGSGYSYGTFNLKEEAEQCAALRQLGYAELLDEIKAAVNNYHRCNSATSAGPLDKKFATFLGDWGPVTTHVLSGGGWVENHSIRDYDKLVRLGFGGLKKAIDDELQKHAISEVDYPQRENFLLAVRSICDAGITLGKRYAELAGQMAARAASTEERQRLESIAAVCRRIPECGATTLREAVQALWFGHIITCADDHIINANSLGHLDRIFEPYYQADLAAGRITRQDAIDLMVELAVKLYLDYDVQAITLGGSNADGSSAVTEMSYILLEATAEFGELRDLSIRVDRQTPDKFLLAAANLVIRGGGIPFFFNDDCFIPALNERGIPLPDARTYSPIGCVELTIPGKANPHAVSGWFDLPKCLELALFNGVDPATGTQVGPQTGNLTELTTFTALQEALQKQITYFASHLAYICRRGELLQREFGPLPSLSLLTDDCIKRGRDITDGGALYNYHSICFMGVPDTADSLAAMAKFVYGDGSVKLDELEAALKANFKGYETLRQKLLKGAPKYGNDNDEVDQLAASLCNQFIDLMDSWSVPNNRFFVHLFTFFVNVNFGRKIGALPDGRLAGEPLAYSLSAHQGRDLNGLTAMLHSLAKMPHRKAAAGSAAIIDLHPSLLENVNGPEMLVQLVKSAFAMGVGQLQWNVVSADQLKKAQTDPEHYGNIPVRVAGYSQLFKLIEPDLQNHIIARYKHTEV